MRSILLLTFVTATFSVFAQSVEKGNPSFCVARLTIHHVDGSSNDIGEFHSDILSYQDGTADTITYELQDSESLTASFYILSPFINPTQFHEELIYGTLVSDTIIEGYSSLGGGTPTWNKFWDFADTALFTFFVNETLNPNPIHVVKLTRKPSEPLLVADQTILPISVFPNPTSNNVYIQLPNVSTDLSLVDASGRELKTWKSSVSHELDLSAFQSGNYFLRIVADGKASVFKLQKVD